VENERLQTNYLIWGLNTFQSKDVQVLSEKGKRYKKKMEGNRVHFISILMKEKKGTARSPEPSRKEWTGKESKSRSET